MVQSLILHIPHASAIIPSYDGFVVPKETIQDELNILTDWFTDDLFDLPCHRIIVPFSRLFCDVERFADDNLEVMSRVGMGMLYTHLDSGQHMRLVGEGFKNRVKSEYYDKHHNKLNELTGQVLDEHGKVLLIDCHSFTDKPLKRDLDKNPLRPAFCIGTDDFHTPKELAQTAKVFLESKGYSVEINKPYSGTMVPGKYYKIDANVKSIMIEVNRSLYLNKGTATKSEGYNSIKQLIHDLFERIEN